MFGDPVMNPMGWDIQSLTNFGEFKNGLNYSKSDEGVGIRCLGVGDFKDKSILVDVESISKVYLSDIPKDDYFLERMVI
jgi:type I restriction enzyme S subunit